MFDLYVAMLVMTVAAAGLGVGMARVTRRWWKWARLLMLLGLVGLLWVDLRYLRDSLWIARYVTVANLIVWANLTPSIGALVIGVAWGMLPGSAWRRSVLIVPMAGLCFWSAYGSVFAPAPMVADRWRDEVCRQTTSATCSPAAAATILRLYGIETTEGEMARACLTSEAGTSMRGLYRGLMTAGRARGLEVVPLRATLDELPRHTPAILTVRLEPGAKADPRFEKKWGWAPGVSHHVVLIRQLANGRYEIADPSVGRESWDRLALETLWHGEGVEVRGKLLTRGDD